MILLKVFSALAITRKITDSTDTFDTFIRNQIRLKYSLKSDTTLESKYYFEVV